MEGEISIPKATNSAFKHLGISDATKSHSQGSLLNNSGSNNNSPKNGFLEADMSDSVFDYPLRKQCSTSVLQSSTHSLGASASHPNLIVKDDLHILHRTPTPPFSPSPPPPSSTTAGQDITDNGSEDKFLTLDPLDLANFRKWIVGFCIVNFDLEIGQGEYLPEIMNPSPCFCERLTPPPCMQYSAGLCLSSNGFDYYRTKEHVSCSVCD